MASLADCLKRLGADQTHGSYIIDSVSAYMDAHQNLDDDTATKRAVRQLLKETREQARAVVEQIEGAKRAEEEAALKEKYADRPQLAEGKSWGDDIDRRDIAVGDTVNLKSDKRTSYAGVSGGKVVRNKGSVNVTVRVENESDYEREKYGPHTDYKVPRSAVEYVGRGDAVHKVVDSVERIIPEEPQAVEAAAQEPSKEEATPTAPPTDMEPGTLRGQQGLFEPMPGPDPGPPATGSPVMAIGMGKPVALDDIIKDGRRGLGRARALAQRLFLGRGTLPQDVYKRKLESNSWVASELKQIEMTNRDYDQAIKEVFGGRDHLPAEERAKLSAVLKGDLDPEQIHESLREPIRKMRNQIDALSRQLIDSGAVEGPLAATIEENAGVYVTRSYRVFDDPAWADKVPEEVRNKAKAHIRQEFPDATENQIEHAIESLLYAGKAADTPMSVLSRSKLGSKDLSVLIKRKNVPLWLRRLWGEYDDPLVEYSRSATKVANLIGNHHFLTKAREEGLGRYFFEKDDPDIDPEAKAQIAADGSEVMAPLNGLWTYPEIKKAFEREFAKENFNPLTRAYLRVNGFVKAGKTILSPITSIRNFNANWAFDFIAGVRSKDVKGGFVAAAPGLESWIKPRSAEARKEHLRLIKLGVIDEGVQASELRQALKDAADMHPDQFSDKTVERFVAKAGKKAADVYQWGDSVHRIMGFYSLRDQYAKAHPEWSAEQLDAKAAELVNTMYPTYSRVSEGVKALGRWPLLGTFVRFPAEVIRTTGATLDLVKQELADPKTRAIGAQRLARIVAVAALPEAAAVALRMWIGVTPDDEDDLREFMPPWSKNSLVMWLGKDDAGKLNYIDASYSDPHAYIRKPLRAFLRGGDWRESLTGSAGEVGAPFLSEEILASSLFDVVRNTTKDGREVYNPEAPMRAQLTQIGKHVWKALEPGGITTARRIGKGLSGKAEETGRTYDPFDEVTALLTGQRFQEIDLRQSLGFKSYQHSQRSTKAQRIFTKLLNSRGSVTEKQLVDAYKESEYARRQLFEELHESAWAAVRQGVPEKEVQQILAQGVGQEKSALVMNGTHKPYWPSANAISTIIAKPDGKQRMGALSAAYDQAVSESAPQERQLSQKFSSDRRKSLQNSLKRLRGKGDAESRKQRQRIAAELGAL